MVYGCHFFLFTQLGDVGSAVNYTVEALKVGNDITLFLLLMSSHLICPCLHM